MVVVHVSARTKAEAVRIVREEFRRHNRKPPEAPDDTRACFGVEMPSSRFTELELQVSPDDISEQHIAAIFNVVADKPGRGEG